MQEKVKLVKWGLMTCALFIIGITTFAGQLLVTRASTSLNLNDKPSCQLVKGTKGDTKLALSQQIPNALKDLLTENNGSVKFSLQCKKPPVSSPTPCIEASGSTCKPSTAPSPTPCIEASGSTCKPGTTPTPTPSPTPDSTPNPTPSSTPTTPNPTPNPTPNSTPNSSPNQTISVTCTNPGPRINCAITGPSNLTLPTPSGPLTCMYQQNQLSCTGPSNLTLPTPNGPVNCGIQNKQLVCSGSALIPLLATLLGVTLPPTLPSNVTISCQPQNNQLVCTPAANPAALITCMLQSGQTVCTAPLPSLGLSSRTVLNCVNQTSQASQATCISHSYHTFQLASNNQTAKASCELVKGTDAGNTTLTLSSDISDKLKGLLEKNDDKIKYSLNCNS